MAQSTHPPGGERIAEYNFAKPVCFSEVKRLQNSHLKA